MFDTGIEVYRSVQDVNKTYTHNVIITPVVYSGFLSQKTGFRLLVPPSGVKPLAGCGLSTATVELPLFNSDQDWHSTG